MIHEVQGDILLTKAQAIAHGIAPGEHFTHGLALRRTNAGPRWRRTTATTRRQSHPKPGELWVWGGVGGVRIFNLLTQEGEHGQGAKPGKATEANVNHCLRRLRHEIDKGEIKSLAMPKLATGVGGLDWAKVRPLIQAHLGEAKIPIFIYATYHKDMHRRKEAGV